MEKIKIALVDDHNIVREGVKALLSDSDHFEVVAEARNGEHALMNFKKNNIDVIVSDISMPNLNGIDFCMKLRETGVKTPVIILSMHNNKEYLMNAYKAGASGYLAKDCDKEELYYAINQVHKGGNYFGNSITYNMLEGMNDVSEGNLQKFNSLTKREKEILSFLLQGYTTKQIANETFISFRTVDKHRSNMMGKIGVNNVVDLLNFINQNGFIV
jgi:DNA-binding NarL/FixJ family response regulator